MYVSSGYLRSRHGRLSSCGWRPKPLGAAPSSSTILALGSIPKVTTVSRAITLIHMINISSSAQLINNEVRASALGLAVGAVHTHVARRALATVVFASTLLEAVIGGGATDEITGVENFGDLDGGARVDVVTSGKPFASLEGLAEGYILWLRMSEGKKRGKQKDDGETHVGSFVVSGYGLCQNLKQPWYVPTASRASTHSKNGVEMGCLA